MMSCGVLRMRTRKTASSTLEQPTASTPKS